MNPLEYIQTLELLGNMTCRIPKKKPRTTLRIVRTGDRNKKCVGCGHKNKKCTCGKYEQFGGTNMKR